MGFRNNFYLRTSFGFHFGKSGSKLGVLESFLVRRFERAGNCFFRVFDVPFGDVMASLVSEPNSTEFAKRGFVDHEVWGRSEFCVNWVD